MSAGEFSEWLAYSQLDPLPDLNLSTGVIAHTVAAGLWSGKGSRPKIEDYTPRGRYADEAIDADDAAERLIKQFGAIPRGG